VRRESGYSLVELVVTTAVFGIFLMILVGLEGHFRKLDTSSRVELLAHPENISVLTRLRRDTFSSHGYPASFAGHIQSPTTLILTKAANVTVVWTFDGHRARRSEYAGFAVSSAWVANAVPRYAIGSYEMPDGAVAVRIRGYDRKGGLAVDEILTPRAQ
jgi:prepilin-type N-terminal cleavage/methylation domain-containing protein